MEMLPGPWFAGGGLAEGSGFTCAGWSAWAVGFLDMVEETDE